jgi:CBS domain containing-hemolysin-like protein
MLSVLADYPLHLAVMAALLAASFFFSGSETALFSLTWDQLRRFRAARSPFRNLAARLMDDPKRLLVTVLFGNLTVNTAFFALSVLLMLQIDQSHPSYARQWRFVITVVAPLAVIVLGEVTPKSVAATMPARLAPIAAGPLTLLQYVVLPVRLVLGYAVVAPLERLVLGRRPPRGPIVTTDELQAVVEVAAREGVVSRDESDMLDEVLELARLRVREVMTPRVEIVACDVHTPMADVIHLFCLSRHAKIVVYDRRLDNVCGVVYAKTAFLNPEKPLGELVRKVRYVPEMKTVESLLREFRAERIQFAIVVDEYGGLAGLVTLEDCLEAIVGEIEDTSAEPAEAEPVERLGPAEYRLAGDLSIRSWADLFEQAPPRTGGRTSTVAGFVTSLLGRVPSRGDTARWRNLEFTVEEVKGRRVTRVRLRLCQELGTGNSELGTPSELAARNAELGTNPKSEIRNPKSL